MSQNDAEKTKDVPYARTHDYKALIQVFEERDNHLDILFFDEPCEWVTGIAEELGKVAQFVNRNQLAVVESECEKAKFKEALTRVAGLSLAWLDYLNDPNTVRPSSDTESLVREVERRLELPEGSIKPNKK